MGSAAASAGAVGPSEGLRAGRSSGQTSRSTPRRADYATTGAGRRPGLGARLRPTRHGPGGTLLDLIAVLFIIGQLEELGTNV